MVNKVILLGNVGKDPEVRSTPNGQTVATFSLATSRKWKDKSGNKQEETEWHNVVVWGKTAELAGKYVTKGRQIYVEGRLQTRSWEDRQSGEKKYRTEVVCDSFQLLGKNPNAGQGGSGGYADDREPAGGGGEAQGGGWGDDDDIPF